LEIRRGLTIEMVDKLKKSIDLVEMNKSVMSFKWRLTEPCQPIKGEQNRIFPLEDKLTFETYLTAFSAPTTSNGQCNFKFSDGTKTEYKASVTLQDVLIPDAVKSVRKITIWYQASNGFMVSIMLLDKDGVKLCEFGWAEASRKAHPSKELLLEEGERIVGIKCRSGTDACQHDLQFVIGRLG
jgi:hypothetical protein